MTALAIALGITSAVLLAAGLVLWRKVRSLGGDLASVRRTHLAVQAERDLRRAGERRLSMAIDRLPVGVAAYDTTGHVVFANPVAHRYIEARHGEAVVERAIERLVAAAVATSDEQSTDIELHGPGKAHLHLEAVPLEQDEALAAIVVIEDRTQQRRTDEIRRDFVANVSHELKTPLGALSVLAGALEGETSPETLQRLSRRIAVEANRMGRLIEDILDLSRVEADPFDAVVVSLDDVVRRVVDRAVPAARRTGVEIALSMPEHGVKVMGDEGQLDSAMSNLISNAVKFTAARSDSATPVNVTLTTGADEVVLTVADAGVGIARDHLDRIFERFYRVDRGRSRDTGGTGLGLAIVRHVVKNHGGEIAVESELGRGSTFTIRLPFDPALQSTNEGGVT